MCATPIGRAVRQVMVIRDVSTYDHLASIGHSLAFPGAVLGAVSAGLRMSVMLVLALLLLGLDLELDTLSLCAAAAFLHGALVGLFVGSQLPAPGPLAMRRGLASGKAVVRVTTGDLGAAMLAHAMLARAPAAERSLGD